MKKLIILVLIIFVIASCSKRKTGRTTHKKENTIKEVSTEKEESIQNSYETPVVEIEEEKEDIPAVKEKKEETPPVPEKKSGLSKEFLEAMDAYEEFIYEYCDFMQKYSESESTAALLMDYAKFMADYAVWTAKFEKWESAEMSDEETDYYIQVQLRCNQKLIETASSIN